MLIAGLRSSFLIHTKRTASLYLSETAPFCMLFDAAGILWNGLPGGHPYFPWLAIQASSMVTK